jgi:hypothetical protein
MTTPESDRSTVHGLRSTLTTMDEINAAEDAQRAAWARGDTDAATDLRARLVRLWERERAERAARRGVSAVAPAHAPGRGPRERRAGR